MTPEQKRLLLRSAQDIRDSVADIVFFCDVIEDIAEEKKPIEEIAKELEEGE